MWSVSWCKSRAVAARFAAELRAPRFASVVCTAVGLVLAAVGTVLWLIYPDPGTAMTVPLARGRHVVNVSSLYEDLVFGGILIIALMVDGLRRGAGRKGMLVV